jgi:hypothetical protein
LCWPPSAELTLCTYGSAKAAELGAASVGGLIASLLATCLTKAVSFAPIVSGKNWQISHRIVDMKAFFACGHDTIKADGIAVGALHSLRQHYNGKLKLHEVKQLFVLMRDQV